MGNGTRGFPRDVADVRMPYRRWIADVDACVSVAYLKKKRSVYRGVFVILGLTLGNNITRPAVDEEGGYLSVSVDNAYVIIRRLFKKQSDIDLAGKTVFVRHRGKQFFVFPPYVFKDGFGGNDGRIENGKGVQLDPAIPVFEGAGQRVAGRYI